MKPKILLFSSINDSMTVTAGHGYARAIERAGGIPIAAQYIEDVKNLEELIVSIDGVFMTGGADVDPARYGEEKSEKCGEPQKYRDELEITACRIALAANKPVLGVCRGNQLINVALGGTLYQDIPSGVTTDILHRQAEPSNSPSHSVNVVENTPLEILTGQSHIKVNSLHHQAIKKLGEGLVPMAVADDGIVESTYSPDAKYLRTYQWHPELLIDIDEISRRLFSDFVDACTKK